MTAPRLFARIAWFELRYQLRQPALLINFALFFLLTFLATTVDQIQIGGRSSGVHMDAPFTILMVTSILSLFAMGIPLRGLTDPVLRDDDTGMAGLIGATSVPRPLLLAARLAGAFIACAVAISACQWGTIVGRLAWWVDPEHFGAFRPWDYLYALGVFGLPDMAVTGALFFAVAAFTRRQMATYIAMIALLVAYLVISRALSDPGLRPLMSYLDPFGIATLQVVTRYWTVVERNGLLPPLTGALLANRLIWIAVSLGLIVLGLVGDAWALRRGPRRTGAPAATETRTAPPPLRPVATALTAATLWSMLRVRLQFEATATVRSPSFLILLAVSLMNLTATLLLLKSNYDVTSYPVTREMVTAILGAFSIAPFAIAGYYSGELVWRDRQANVAEILGATPAPGWVFTVSKYLAIALVLAGLWLVAIVPAAAVQLARGPVPLEPGLYLVSLLGTALPDTLILLALTLFVQVLSPNKFVGYAVMVLYVVFQMKAGSLGLEDKLLVYGTAPNLPLSDMNGYGHFLLAHIWFDVYWGAAAGLLLVLAHLIWPRGRALTWRDRRRALATGWTRPMAALACLLVLVFAGSGGWTAWNTHHLNQFRTQDEREALQVDYENAYRQYETLPQPRIVAVSVAMDLHPAVQGYDAHGHYILENRTGQPLTQVHVVMPTDTDLESMALEGGHLTTDDQRLHYRIFTLDQPLAPGGRLRLDFAVSQRHPGFTNDANAPMVVGNGSFINNWSALPTVGFSRQAMLQDKFRRRKHHLPPIDREPKLEDSSQWAVSDLGPQANLIDFDTTISTDPDQTAVAPGYLEREWTAMDATGQERRYFHYASDAPIPYFVSWLSARYAVAHDSWTGGTDGKPVDLAVYYHAPHVWNVDRMMTSMKQSLAYCSTAFGPYQHRQVRILEFPDYARFAQSFPNTVPFSEGMGFIEDNRDKTKIDSVFYVTAHEVAHQWWGHQLEAANVQGNTLLVETLAQYTSLMVMEHQYGPNQIRKFLKYELDRYLSSRGHEELEELPLNRVEDQPYIHYRKGAVVMYALKDYLGEDVVNRALARLLREGKARTDRYALSTDLVDALKAEAGPQWSGLIDDMLTRIVLYDLKVTGSSAEALPDGRFKVRLDIHAGKLEADGQGKETPQPFSLPIDVGLFLKEPGKGDFADGDVIHLAKQPIHDGDQTIELVVDRKPGFVGIDPYNKLIDRNSDDNVAKLGAETGS
ncbi:MAG: M1 family aminopeptidase [Azospirillaceae bacterium]|nr:M1 family aminopeptidase [Azospirillaceae bacterium]